jgi:chromate transporter
MAVVTFGGAYAVLAYVAQEAVQGYQWLSPAEMLTGLGLAETTPGPLILVLQFVGFLAGYRAEAGLNGMAGGLAGTALTLWVTFAPCFAFVFLGAPLAEKLLDHRLFSGALAAITASIVGVIANLALWFAVHVFFKDVQTLEVGAHRLEVPVLSSFDPAALLIAALAAFSLFYAHRGVGQTLALAALAGICLRLVF